MAIYFPSSKAGYELSYRSFAASADTNTQAWASFLTSLYDAAGTASSGGGGGSSGGSGSGGVATPFGFEGTTFAPYWHVESQAYIAPATLTNTLGLEVRPRIGLFVRMKSKTELHTAALGTAVD